MSRRAMHALMVACAAVIGVASARVWNLVERELNAPRPPIVLEPPPPLVTPPLPGFLHVNPEPATDPVKPLGMTRRAALILVGTWHLDEKATREANGDLSAKEANRLRREIDGMRGALATYREDGNVAFVEESRGSVLGSARWVVEDLSDSDVILTYEYEDKLRTRQRVMLPAYDAAATQMDEFVFVWRRHVQDYRAVAQRVKPAAPRSGGATPVRFASQQRADAPAAVSHAWESEKAEKRWNTFRKTSAQQYGAASGCEQQQQCARACRPDNPSCLQQCNNVFPCEAAPLYVR